MKVVRTTITIEQHRTTVFREVRYAVDDLRSPQPRGFPTGVDEVDPQGPVTDISHIDDEMSAGEPRSCQS